MQGVACVWSGVALSECTNTMSAPPKHNVAQSENALRITPRQIYAHANALCVCPFEDTDHSAMVFRQMQPLDAAKCAVTE